MRYTKGLLRNTNNKIVLSIIICTYNRAPFLKFLLSSIEALSPIDSDYEIIIVNNNSTDETEELCRSYCYQHSNWYYFIEPIQGVSFARNRGWAEAKGDYLLYMDDECILPVGYLSTAFKIIVNYNPDFFGGPIYPYFNFKKPEWLKDEYFGHHLGIKRGFIKNQYLSTGNMGIKKKLMSEVGGFDIRFGITGKKRREMIQGEDTYIQICAYRIREDIKVFFETDLWLYHQEFPEKIKLCYSVSRSFQTGVTYPQLAFELNPEVWVYRMSTVIQILKVLRLLLQILLIGMKLTLSAFRNRARYPFWYNYYYEQIKKEIFKTGYYYGVLTFCKCTNKK